MTDDRPEDIIVQRDPSDGVWKSPDHILRPGHFRCPRCGRTDFKSTGSRTRP